MIKTNNQILNETTSYRGSYFQQLSECLDDEDIVLGGQLNTASPRIYIIGNNEDYVSDVANRIGHLLDCITTEYNEDKTIIQESNLQIIYGTKSLYESNIIKEHHPIILCHTNVYDEDYITIKDNIINEYSKFENSLLVYTNMNNGINTTWYKRISDVKEKLVYLNFVRDGNILFENGSIGMKSSVYYDIPLNTTTYLLENKPLIEFDKDKNMIINHNIDLLKEYKNSHRLVMIYLKDNNIEGLKFEATKLYYLNYLLDKKLNNRLLMKSKYNSSTYKNLKSDILNDFTRCIKALPDDFNFGEYYNSTEFSHNSTVVSDTTIKGVSNLIKSLL